ncbi:MAG: radical SAM protein [bacterium]
MSFYEYSGDINEEYLKGFNIRKEYFGSEIHFYAPSIKSYETEDFKNNKSDSFPPFSITGSSCSLKCEHCNAEILKSMSPALTPGELYDRAQKIYEAGGSGFLLSGGSDSKGIVDILPYISIIKKIKSDYNLKVIVHCGLITEEIADGLSEAGADSAMLDIIGDEDTIRKIYHLNATVKDYENSLRFLSERGIPCSPHVVIGLKHGIIAGEYNAIDIISRYNISSLVLVGFMPMHNTRMENIAPPEPEEIGEVFLYARKKFTETPVLLGCERPYGLSKFKIEELAVKSGLNGIAYPSEGIIPFSKKLGLKPKFSEVCCSLIFSETALPVIEMGG